MEEEDIAEMLDARLAPMLALYERQVEAQEKTAVALSALALMGQQMVHEFVRAMVDRMKEDAEPK